MGQLHLRPVGGLWIVRCGGTEIARSTRAVELSEGDHPPVIVFPPEDVVAGSLQPGPAAVTPISNLPAFIGRPRPCAVIGAEGPVSGAALLIEAPRLPLQQIAGWVLFDAEKLTVAAA